MGYEAWVKLEHTTPDKPEIFRMSEILNIDPDAVFGKAMRFWIWSDQNTDNGQVFVSNLSQVDRITHCPGFGQAMVDVGWLVKEGGSLVIPKFDRHNSESAKKRANNARHKQMSRIRQVSVREMSANEPDKTMTTSSSMSMSSSTSLSGKDEGVGEGKVDDVFQDLPPPLKTDTLKAEWLRWEKYLKEVHSKPMQPMMRGPAWQKVLERAPPGKEAEYAISTIREAMAAGWKNLYPQEEKQHGRSGRRADHARDSGKSAGGGRLESIKPRIVNVDP